MTAAIRNRYVTVRSRPAAIAAKPSPVLDCRWSATGREYLFAITRSRPFRTSHWTDPSAGTRMSASGRKP